MSIRILAQSEGVTKLEYNLVEKKVVADHMEYSDVDGLYFEGDVYMVGKADYSVGVVELAFDYPTTVALELVSIDGYAIVLVIKQPQVQAQMLATLWRPGELLGRLLGRRERAPYATKIRELLYDPATRQAKAYNTEAKTFENITSIRFQSLGDGSRIQRDRARLVPPVDFYFVVKQKGNVLVVENERGA
jgi:hypothetical protein